MQTNTRPLRGAALRSHACKVLEDARKDGAQIEIRKSYYLCPSCNESGTVGTYSGPTTYLKVWTCLHCGKSHTKGGYTAFWQRDMNPRPDDKKREFLYGDRAEAVKLETRSLFTVAL